MNKGKLFSIRCNLEVFLWLFAIFFGFMNLFNPINFVKFIPSMTIFTIGFLRIPSFLYFKKVPSVGSSPRTGKAALFWTIGETAFVFYLGYFFWPHFL